MFLVRELSREEEGRAVELHKRALVIDALGALRPTEDYISDMEAGGLTAVGLTLIGLNFGRYMERSSARRAAEVFGLDLSVARNQAARSRQVVVVDFDETARNYVIRVAAGDTVVTRFFDADSDLTLTEVDLELGGDTVAFNSRGVADLSGATLGRAVFTLGETSFAVSFNALGSSRVIEET